MPQRTIPLRTVFVLGALSAFGPLSMDLYLPALPQLARDLHSTAATAQLTMSSCMVGLAVGQLLLGPVSDRYGRRRPLLIGVAAYAVTSLLCALAPGIGLLIVLRLVQGLAGGAGIVIARAVVRDLCETDAAAQVFSMLMLVTGIAPVVAPVAGGQLLRVTSWPGLFVTLCLIGCVLLAAAAIAIRETLPPADRHQGGFAAAARQFAALRRDARFVGFTGVLGLGSVVLFAYIVMSPFVLQGGYGLSAQEFSYCFAANSVGLIAASRLALWLTRRTSADHTLRIGLAAGLAGSCALVAITASHLPLAAVLPVLWVTVSSVALVMPTATALGLASHSSRAGTAAGVMGLAQFGVGGIIAPIVSASGATAIAMASTMAAAGALALLIHGMLSRPSSPARSSDPVAGTTPVHGPAALPPA
jgi:MFS transporter, DHA1 family, multidrug resistance protein